MNENGAQQGTTQITGGSNMLNEYQVEQLHQLTDEGNGIRAVSRIMGIARKTVRRYLRGEPRKGRHSPAWHAMEEHREEVRKLFFDCKGNCSAMHRFVSDVIGMEAPGLRTLQKFCEPFRLELKQARLKKTERFETAPGHQMQIDFGEDDVQVGGENTRVHFFVAKLGYSRRIFAKAYLRETQDNWLDGVESAFKFFDGLPWEIVCDNAKALVKKHDAPQSERFTENFDWLCSYYGVIPVATAVGKQNSKGKVESGVKYVKHNALVNCSFENLEELNHHLENWSVTVSDKHIISDPFLTGPKTPAERWVVEKQLLRPNTKPRIGTMRCLGRKVDKNGLIRVDNAHYRVPDVFALCDVVAIVSEETTTVRCGERVTTLNKAKDAITAKDGQWSNPVPKEGAFEEVLKERQADESWNRMQSPQCQRSPSAYDAAFQQGA